MRILRWVSVVYFSTLVVLSLLSLAPAFVFISLFFFGAGFIIIAAPTILLYSTAAFPVLFAFEKFPRRLAFLPLTLLPSAAIAFIPGIFSRQEVTAFTSRMSKNDFETPAKPRPRVIEIAIDYRWTDRNGPPELRAPCEAVCQKLLFNQEVVRVRVTKLPWLSHYAPPGQRTSVTYRIEKRDWCPQVLPAGSNIEIAVRDRIAAGDCLIADPDDQMPADAQLATTTVHQREHMPLRGEPAQQLAPFVHVYRLLIAERQNDGTYQTVLLRTESQLDALAIPFYIGYRLNIQGSGYNGPVLGRSTLTVNPIDDTEILRRVFGFTVAPVTPLPSFDARETSERFLSLLKKEGQVFTAQHQSALIDALALVVKKSTLNEIDIDFVRRVVRDPRVNEGQVAIKIADLFKKFPEQLAPLIPDVIARLAIPTPEQTGHYHSILAWALVVYPGELLQPHRAQILQILEEQLDWHTGGLLARMGEMAGDPTDVILRGLNHKSNAVRQAAATAICRAKPELWARLRPIALEHLDKPSSRLADESKKLLLAFVRFGERPLADEMLGRQAVRNMERYQRRWDALAPESIVNHCQGFM